MSDTRSLWDIISSCLLTLFACTYVSVHPNVPSPNASQLTVFLTRIKLMILALVAPEILLAWAARQSYVAHTIQKGQLLYLTTKHSNSHLKKEFKIPKQHAFFLTMGGFVGQIREGKTYPLHKPDIVRLGLESTLRRVPEKEISSRSKADHISKAIAVLQLLWFIIQCIARKIQHLPTTSLELVTIAFGGISGVMYCVWWDKPMAVECPIVLTKDLGSPLFLSWTTAMRQEDTLRDPGVLVPNAIWETVFYPRIRPRQSDSRVPHLWPGGTSLGDGDEGAALLLIFTSVIFGGIHCLGWNFYYPTTAEALIWQVCSVLITGGPVLVTLFFIVVLVIDEEFYDTMPYTDQVVTFLGMFFVGARLILLILPFVLLRDLPSAAFDTVSWTRFIPHVSSGIQ